MKRLAGALVAVVAILGMKFYNKASAHDDVQARLVELCEGDSAVPDGGAGRTTTRASTRPTRWAAGTSPRSSTLNNLVKCVNSHAGEEYFTVDEEKK